MPRVTFLPSGKHIDIESGAYLLDAALDAGLPVQQQCGNMSICGWCVMEIVSGAEHLDSVEKPEQLLAKRNNFTPTMRASCQTRVLGNVVVRTPYW